MLPLGVREDLLCSTSVRPSCRRNDELDASYTRRGVLPEVSLRAKPHCDLASDCDGRGRTLGLRRLPVRVSPLG